MYAVQHQTQMILYIKGWWWWYEIFIISFHSIILFYSFYYYFTIRWYLLFYLLVADRLRWAFKEILELLMSGCRKSDAHGYIPCGREDLLSWFKEIGFKSKLQDHFVVCAGKRKECCLLKLNSWRKWKMFSDFFSFS